MDAAHIPLSIGAFYDKASGLLQWLPGINEGEFSTVLRRSGTTLAADHKTFCMPWNQLIGTNGEMRVKEWLSSKGFRLHNLCWNCAYGEIDIIASFLDQLHFIAVTTKTFAQNGLPAEGITRKKMLSCKQAAQKYLERHPRWKKVIFDVMAVSPTENEQEIILLKDV